MCQRSNGASAQTPSTWTARPISTTATASPATRRPPPAGVTPLVPVQTDPNRDPEQLRGHKHTVTTADRTGDSAWGIQMRLGFAEASVVYEPMRATREAAAAFGMTLVEPGQCVPLGAKGPGFAAAQYEYGVFAGHQSPYLGTGNRLLSIVCTDLEHHDFPHVFASIDTLPLVISVGRFLPEERLLFLADLWVRPGDALYVSPKPDVPHARCIDLHNNRNAARACWGDIGRDTLRTHTFLQTQAAYFHWYWNPQDTVHTHPPGDAPTGSTTP